VRGMRGTHFVVTPEMADLRRMERDPRVESINIVTWEWWSSMWETAFLLGKPLYQKAGSYYLKSERLEGQWTLKEIREPPDDVLVQAPLDPAHVIEVNPSYTLVRSASLMELEFGTGWHGGEPGHRWTSEQRATVLVDAYAPRRAMLELTYTHLLPGTAFGVLLGDRQVGRCVEPELCSVGPLELPAGLSTLTLASSRPPELPGPGSPRVVGTAYRLIRFTPMEAN